MPALLRLESSYVNEAYHILYDLICAEGKIQVAQEYENVC